MKISFATKTTKKFGNLVRFCMLLFETLEGVYPYNLQSTIVGSYVLNVLLNHNALNVRKN
jgi:hypothetical protein